MGESENEKLYVAMVVGNNIRQIIKDKGLKTRKISELADMDIETLRKYTNGKMEMGISRAVRIANALEVGIEELFSYTPKTK